jgi:hypothetical protein
MISSEAQDIFLLNPPKGEQPLANGMLAEDKRQDAASTLGNSSSPVVCSQKTSGKMPLVSLVAERETGRRIIRCANQ